MRPSTILAIAAIFLVTAGATAQAQQPYPGMPPNMGELQQVQAEFEAQKKQKEQERKAITDRIAAEELARARQEQAASGSRNDPHAVAEMRTRERLQALSAEWKKEDRELEYRMHEKMMQKSGMGDIMKMQQQMMENQGYGGAPAPAAPPAR